MPDGDVFAALLADPKQPHSYASALWARSAEHSRLVAAAAFGDDLGLVRWGGAARGDGIQIGLAGAVFAQFDLLEASVPLINADYTFGVPVTYRRRIPLSPPPARAALVLWHGGLEYWHPRRLRLPAGADLKRDGAYDRLVDVSLRAGMEIGPTLVDGEEWRHHWDLLAEYYDGRSHYGQFFNEKLSYLGIGIHFFL